MPSASYTFGHDSKIFEQILKNQKELVEYVVDFRSNVTRELAVITTNLGTIEKDQQNISSQIVDLSSTLKQEISDLKTEIEFMPPVSGQKFEELHKNFERRRHNSI
jgi:hypothetical protein